MNKIRYIILGSTFILYMILVVSYVSVAQWSWYAIPTVLLAWFNADLTLGLVHFYLDYVCLPSELNLKDLLKRVDRGSDTYQALKKEKFKQLNLIQKVSFEFKIHHIRPKALGKRTFINLVSESIMVIVFPLLIIVDIGIYFGVLHHLVILYFLILSLGLSLGQYTHANTHKDDIPWVIRFLQNAHIILPVKLHLLHHSTFTQSFCILNGWSNRLVNKIANFVLARKIFDRKNLEIT